MKPLRFVRVLGRVLFGYQFLFRTAGVALAVILGARPALSALAPASQVLVYANGDRLQGSLIAREGDTLVFRSVRFGELRVPADKASIIDAPPVIKHAKVVKAVRDNKGTAKEPDASESLAKWLKDYLGPWSGRFAVSSETSNDTQQGSDFMVEAQLNRTWTKDEVAIGSRYTYGKTNGSVTSDLLKGNGSWRHMLPRRLFTVYRPAYEWNRAYQVGGINSDYFFLQQEVGGGVALVKTKKWEVRTGLAENLFDTWGEATGEHGDTHAESVFSEANLQLPWRIALAERAVYYYAFDSGNDGWEHEFEITKKLTDSLSLGLKQEVRYNDPDVRSQDYSLLRLLLGLDF